jgi:RDD family.
MTYAGAALGLPASGSGSLARLGRRFVGVLVDWLVAQLVVFVVARDAFGAAGAASFLPLAVFAVLTVLSLSVVAATFGHYVMGLQLRQVRPGTWPLQALIRTLLLCLFLPAVLTAKDGRGLHDVAAGTVLVRR